MPISPLVVAGEMLGWPHLAGQHTQHEKGELRSGFGQNVGRVGERNFIAVGIGTIDIVKTDGNLGHNFQRIIARFKNLGINRIAECGDQPVNARLHLIDDQALRWRYRLRINLDFVSAIAQQVKRLSNITSRKNAEFLGHEFSHRLRLNPGRGFQLTVRSNENITCGRNAAPSLLTLPEQRSNILTLY